MIITHSMMVCGAHHLATNTQGQGHNFDSIWIDILPHQQSWTSSIHFICLALVMTGMIPEMDLGEMGFLFCDLLFSLNNPLSGG